MEYGAPASDEIELSVFGRGYGEAICVHLGENEWMLVDSCIDPTTGAAAALSYLAALGVSVARAVRLIIATHWHDDHVKGISAIAGACNNAAVVCSAVLCNQEVLAFVIEQGRAAGAIGSGLDEFRRLLHMCAERGRRIVWAKANLPLHPLPPGDVPRVRALSPSDNAFERGLQALIEAAREAKATIPRRYSAPEGPNGASVAAWVQNQEVGLLLGADLETSPNPETGWEAVLKYSRPSKKASAAKIPHHGSASAHHNGMWSELLETDPLAIVTPWIRGRRALPTDGDLQRMKALSKKLYITTMPSKLLARKKPQGILRKLHDAEISEVRGWGHIRARRRLTERDWRVELTGDAVAI